MKKFLFSFLFLLSLLSSAYASAQIQIVAAENFYGDVAEQLGKPYVQVTSLINNPNQDPHLFSASPQMAVLLNHADIVIENGVGYDAWMEQLYKANHTKALLINVGECVHKTPGMNPHIWYDPNTMPIFAQYLVQQLVQQDPAHKNNYQDNLSNFLKTASAYQANIMDAREKLAGIKVTATEPVVGYLIQALGLYVLNQKFQQDVMNEIDLTPHEIIRFEQSLSDKNMNNNANAKLFIYNIQVTSPITEKLKKLAIEHHIPVVGVTETMPNEQHYYAWMTETLNEIEKALS